MDQKQPHQQGDAGEHGEIEMKGGEHFLHRCGAPLRAAEGEPLRQAGAHVLLGLRHIQPGAQAQLDAVQPPRFVEHELGVRDVHDGERLGGEGGFFPAAEDGADLAHAAAVAHEQGDFVAGLQAVLFGKAAREQQCVRLAEEAHEVHAGGGLGVLQRVVAQGGVAQRVHADDAQHLLARAGHGQHIGLHHGRGGAVFAQPGHVRQQALIHTERRAGDLQSGLSRDGIQRGGEPAERAAVRELDAQHHRHPERDAEHGQQGAARLFEERAQDEAGEEHGDFGMGNAECGISGSRSHNAAVFHAHLALGGGGDGGVVGGEQDGDAEVAVQGAEEIEHVAAVFAVEAAGGLVGDEQRGLVHHGARQGGALGLAAGDLGREMRQPVGDADALGQHAGFFKRRLFRLPRQQQRHGDVFQQGERGQEIEELEDEADAVAPQAGKGVVGERGHIPPVQPQRAGIRAVHDAAELEQGGFPAARRPRDGDEIPRRHLQGHASQRGDRFAIEGVGTMQVNGG